MTFGDMMSLLLTFFVLLVSMANFDESVEVMAALEAISEAFGARGQQGDVQDDSVDFKSLIRKLQTLNVPVKPKETAQTEDPGTEGENYRVKRIREGLEVRLGGPVGFEKFSARMLPAMDPALRVIAEQVRGHRNKIEIRGHATVEPLPLDSPFRDTRDLSYARARAVYDRLIELGIEPRALRVTAAGDTEPILTRAYTEERLATNRRVEVVVTQSLIDDFEGHKGNEQELPEQLPLSTVLNRDDDQAAPDSTRTPDAGATPPPARGGP
jgi:chemotaxis protein MotB